MNTNDRNVLSIWQDVRSECGYCKGSRTHVLTKRNPIPSLSGEPEIEIFPVQSSKNSNANDDDDDDDNNLKETEGEGEIVNESTCSNSYACNFDSVLPMSYQLLIDRGWRRSGKLIYRPKNYSTCCPSYPIRMDTHFFRISKSQKKVLKSFSSALCVEEDLQQKGKRQHHETKPLEPSDGYTRLFQPLVQESSLRSILKEALVAHLNHHNFNDISHMCDWKVRKVYKVKRHKDCVTSETILSSSIVPGLSGRRKNHVDKIELAHDIRTMLQKDSTIVNYKHENVDSNGTILWKMSVLDIQVHEHSFQINVVTEMTLYDEYLRRRPYESSQNEIRKTDTTKQHIIGFLKQAKVKNLDQLKPPFTLTVRTIPSHVNQNIHNVHELYCKYQHAIHGDDDPFQSQTLNDEATPQNNDVDSKVDVDSSNTDAEAEEAYSDVNALKLSDFEKKYSNLGKDQIKKIYKSYCSFHRFLCSSPIKRDSCESIVDEEPVHVNGTWDESQESKTPFRISPSDVNVPYGTYHQQYLINDTVLIAVGVVDILPNCLSSVYSLYDPVLSEHFNLGKLTALYEIEWVKHASRLRPNLKYYYLGYYIHSCQKMRYKAEYKPSELNCPARGKWVNYDVAIQRLNRRSPIRHCCDISTPDEQENDMDCENASLQNKEKNEIIQPIRNVLFDIGYESLLTIEKLTPDGVELLQPILEKFVAEAGPEVASSSIIKFC